jgi:hypothetical protein
MAPERDSFSMIQAFLIGIGAGIAAALLFASVASGSPAAVLLFYLAPLPILIAALGWSHWAGLIAATVAAIGLAIGFNAYFFAAFLVGIGLPAWWLGYLALLARPTGEPPPHDLEWYPVGHLVIWAALLGTAILIAALPTLGLDEDTFRASLRRGIERILRVQPPGGGGATANVHAELVEFFALLIPPATAALATITNVVNLWLAALTVRLSGRLRRPWPDLAAMAFPRFTPGLVALAIAGSFVPGMVGIVSGVLCASLLMAYALLGLAVMHSVTRGIGMRPVLLSGLYAVLIFGWPLLLLTLVGLADTAIDIRGRLARKRGLPRSND